MCEIVAVDWNPEQTKLWKHHILKHNPSAKIYTEEDVNPLRDTIPGLGILSCYGRKFESSRVLALQTDVIVTGKLSSLFDTMDRLECSIGATRTKNPQQFKRMGGSKLIGRTEDGRYIGERRNFDFAHALDKLNDKFDVNDVPFYTSGVVAFNEYIPRDLYKGVKAVVDFSLKHDLFDGDVFLDEVALSYFIAMEVKRGLKIFDVPFSIHGLVAKSLMFGGVDEPLLIHYHNFPKLKKFGLSKYLEMG